MSSEQQASQVTPANSPDEKQIADHLQAHPDFFLRHPDLLAQLTLPHPSGRAISLLEHQVNLLRQRSDALQQRLDDFVTNANANDALFEKTRLMILELLKTQSLSELADVLQRTIKQQFQAEECRLMRIGQQAPASAALPGLDAQDLQQALGDLLQSKRAFCGPLEAQQEALLFPSREAPVSSVALVPIHTQDGQALLLAIGSRRAGHFNASQDTLFLDFTGEVIAALLSRQGQ